jgi:hypothetical protein
MMPKSPFVYDESDALVIDAEEGELASEDDLLSRLVPDFN